jgi:hypothetical protein
LNHVIVAAAGGWKNTLRGIDTRACVNAVFQVQVAMPSTTTLVAVTFTTGLWTIHEPKYAVVDPAME